MPASTSSAALALDERCQANRAFTRLAFSDAVKQAQQEYGTREFCAELERRIPANDAITETVAQFIRERNTFILGTANKLGWPHVQHRGGPVGVLKMLSSHQIAFGDFDGNKQLISVGNILENPNVHLLLIDYVGMRRLKIWGCAAVHPARFSDLAGAIRYPNYTTPIQRIITVDVRAWDFNCGQHLNGVGGNSFDDQSSVNVKAE